MKNTAYLEINGAIGEGGGQILRTALALSLCTRKPFRITHIRAGRKKPGLRQQHLTAVHAARDISGAQVEGDEIGSSTVSFAPGEIQPGKYHFAIGTAGSTTLVLQTVLYPLLLATAESHITLTGGTHNVHAPPYDFLAQVYLPVLNRMGVQVTATLDRYGFFPKGGGRLRVHITPTTHLRGLSLMERGKIVKCQATALTAGLPEHIALRELQRVTEKLSWSQDCLHHCALPPNQGPGNVLLLQIQSEHITEIFSGFGQRGIRAEAVAEGAIKMATDYMAANIPVGSYLADQLLLPLALAGEGELITTTPSSHTLTNIETIHYFLSVPITQTHLKGDVWVIRVG
ncbi:MAG: RNA 3'-terminal phosphate cyclase [Gammaproteobacteria bacterium]|nr:MAG: RNA 3'-terminal phosphate cyclase [Gammaproteobacteria bacterium]RKZ76866.1 MAG: RNA 3'-terminal phosphate cyclase [Gammaproteobacteria bacterium]